MKFVVALLAFSMASIGSARAAEVNLVIEGLRNTKGDVAVCLWLDRVGFPDCSKSPTARQQVVRADAASSLTFDNLPGDTFAITLIHDENSNGKFDTTLVGIPKEGAGASNNAVSRFAPPRYAASSFVVRGQATQRIKLVYWLGSK